MSEFVLTLADPESADDCVPEPFHPLARSPLWVAYLTFGRRYLGDVNDDPDLEAEYDTGLGLWVERVRALLDVLTRRSGGLPVRISASTGAGRFVDRLTGRTGRELAVEAAPVAVDPDLLEGLATYGGEATLWTCLPDAGGSADTPKTLGLSRLEGWVRDGTVPWWTSHGYKEPFLAGHTPTLSKGSLAEVIRTGAGIPVVLADEAFVPHRIRMHRRFA